jgi:hypothetical protein
LFTARVDELGRMLGGAAERDGAQDGGLAVAAAA